MALKKGQMTTTVVGTSRKDLIGFILAAEHSNSLTLQFLAQEDANALHAFFTTNGFTDISLPDSKDILKCILGANGMSIDVKGIAASTATNCY